MKVVKYLFAVWAGILIYALLFILFGSTGISAYRQLLGEERKQQANIRELYKINNELENTMNSLLYDVDTLTIFAREQGYAAPGENFIRIVGLGGKRNTFLSSGEVLTIMDPQFITDKTLRIIAFCTTISILICMAAFDFMKSLREPY